MELAIGWNKFNLMLLGVWPEPTKTSQGSRYLSSVIFWSSSFVSFVFICLPQTANLILESRSLDEIIENLSINVPIVFALAKQLILRYHGRGKRSKYIGREFVFEALKLLTDQILEDWTRQIPDTEKQTMLKNAKLSRTISIVSSTLTYFMLIAFISLQIWNNVQNSSEADLDGLLFPATFPYDTKRSPNYQITWLGQFIGTVLTAICYSCFDTFLALLVLHLCGQLTVLRTNLRSLVDTTRHNNFTTFQEKLGSIVHKHEELHRFAIIVENCFNLTLLGQTLISTAMFCLTGYRMITSVDQDQAELPIIGLIFFVIHVLYTMLHLFLYCYIGEQLLTESTGIAQSTYDCQWYELPSQKAISLVIVIMRAKTPFILTAGKFSPFSLELFSTILKTSAGYLSVLLAMNDQLTEEQ